MQFYGTVQFPVLLEVLFPFHTLNAEVKEVATGDLHKKCHAFALHKSASFSWSENEMFPSLFRRSFIQMRGLSFEKRLIFRVLC